MTTPTAYSPQTNFGDDEDNNVSGRSTVRTAQLDAELAAIALFTSQVVSSLTAIQRADGALLDGIVTVASLSTAVQAYLTAAGGTIRGTWLTATSYSVKDVVTNGTGTYICATAHTSGTFATDLAAGKWVTLFNSSSFAASAVSFSPTGGVASTTVQAAIAEVDSEKMRKDANLGDVADAATSRTNLAVPGLADNNTYTGTQTIPDDKLLIVDNADATKKIAFEASGITAGTTRTFAAPDKSGTLAVTSDIPASVNVDNRVLNSGFAIDQRVNSATSVADDTYCLDGFYVLTQTASIQVTQQTDQESGSPYSIRLTQNQAAAQRMGLAQIIEARNCKDVRTALSALAARVRFSTAAAVRYAILEWTGTADSVTSDVVLDWTSASYAAGGFFLAANVTVAAVGSMTPSANTWTNLNELQATLSASCNNVILMVWTEGAAAQNVTLDIARFRWGPGTTAPTWRQPEFSAELQKCQRYYFKTFPIGTAPAQAAGRSGDWEMTAPAALTGSLGSFEYAYPVRMRTTPSITTYNPISANNQARDHTNAADRAPTTLDTSDRRVSFTFATLANGQLGMHLTGSAEL